MIKFNKKVKSIALSALTTLFLFLSVHLSQGDVNGIIDLPSFMLLISPLLALKLNIYLKPITLSLFDKIVNNNYKELTLMSGLSTLCLGHFLMSQGANEPSGLDYVWVAFSASMITLTYALIMVFIFFHNFDKNSNVEPNLNCFDQITLKKHINFRYIFSVFILWILFFGSVQIAFESGAAGGWYDIIGNNLNFWILFIVIIGLTFFKTDSFGYLKSLKILFYDRTGTYDIQKVSSTIKNAKSFLIIICILYVILLIPSMAVSNIWEFYSITANMSITIVKLCSLYIFLATQDSLILQNAICQDKFHQYSSESNLSKIYALILVYFGSYSFFTLLNLIRL